MQADGVIDIERHVAIEHNFNIVTDRLSGFRDQFFVLFQTPFTVYRSVGTCQLHCFESEFQLPIGIVAGGVSEHLLTQRSTEQFIDGLVLNFAVQVPQSDVDAADRNNSLSLATVRFGHTEHHIPNFFNGEAVFADQHRCEVFINDRSNGCPE